MKKSKSTKIIRIIIIVINVINLTIIIFTMRHNIIRKINSWTEKPITELNLSEEQKLADFNYLYDSIVTSMPIETLNGIKTQFNIDFVGRKDEYTDLILRTETDLDFFAAMCAIDEDIPTFHSDILFPDYEYYPTIDCWNMNKVLDTKYIKSKSEYWIPMLRDKCEKYFAPSPVIYSYDYSVSSGEYVSESGEILLEVNGNDIDLWTENISMIPIVYDFINGKAYRKWINFYEEPYSALAEKVTLKVQNSDGTTSETTAYTDITADTLKAYSWALGVKKDDEEPTVNNLPFYSFTDEENDVLYMNFSGIDYISMCDIPDTLNNSDNKNVIIDLRNNTGGYFNIVQEFLYSPLYNYDMEYKSAWYLPDTKYTKKLRSDPEARKLAFKKADLSEKNGLGEEQPYLACEDTFRFKGGDCMDRNVYILTSGKTASAADRLVSVLKDNSAAVVIGTNTGGEGRMDSFLMDSLSESGLVYIYMPELAFNSDGSNNAIYGTAPDIYVREGVPDKKEFASSDPYTYENRLKWDSVLIKAIETIGKENSE